MRGLKKGEIEWAAWFSANNVPYAMLEITSTGLAKSIMDATGPFRDYLTGEGVHDYGIQKQGPEGKVSIPAIIWASPIAGVQSQASLYRPQTKQGDPRVWFHKLKSHAAPNDILCILWFRASFHVFNMSNLNVHDVFADTQSRFGALLRSAASPQLSVRAELRRLMEDIAARGWIKTHKAGDTGVGHLLETELGIAANSDKNPDFKGIEIKAHAPTTGGANRVNLFAQVATWPLSDAKSSKEILDRFGYSDGDDFKLYCTVAYQKPNSQGLSFEHDLEARLLREVSSDPNHPHVATWEEETLMYRLQQKHPETFWVKADKEQRADGTYIRFRRVTNTKNPILSQLMPLIRSQDITMDHLIKRSNGRVSEKGPLFKIKVTSLNQLFPYPDVFDLI